MSEHSGDKRIDDSTSKEMSLGHEGITLKIGPVVWFMIGLSVATVIVFLLMTGLFSVLASRAGKSEDRPSPLADERQKLPPEPRLQLAPTTAQQLEDKRPPNIKQDHPLQEIKRVRAEEDAKLNSYGWVDQKSGVVHIPIDDAKRLLLERGLATRK
ncbi:MAG TPA: hypothetical protein VN937_10560 [Blastocatellia bacterium]|nr:hypothetical protein [Blastocatellia bacterium]